MNVDKRTRARELAMQAIYQLDVQGTGLLESIEQFFLENESDDFARRLASDFTNGTWKNLSTCDELIAACAIKWQLARLSAVDRSIIRLAVYQLRFCGDIPPAVVINEALELAKKFSTDRSASFVNGVLDAVSKKLVSRDTGGEQHI